MFRTLFTAVCAGLALAPNAFITVAERVALDNPEDCERRAWVTTGARLEGLAFFGLLQWSSGSYSAFKKFVGVVGVLPLLFPRGYVNYGTKLAYTGESTPEWRPWVYTWTRRIGLGYALIGFKEWRRDA